MLMKTMLRGACFALALLLLAMSFAAAEDAPKGTRKTLSPGRRVRLQPPKCSRTVRRAGARTRRKFTAVPWRCADNYLPPAYFAGRYRQGFKFDGTEAGAQVTMVNGGEAEIVPQDAFWLTLETEDAHRPRAFSSWTRRCSAIMA